MKVVSPSTKDAGKINYCSITIGTRSKKKRHIKKASKRMFDDMKRILGWLDDNDAGDGK